jgi:hypothetical protein
MKTYKESCDGGRDSLREYEDYLIEEVVHGFVFPRIKNYFTTYGYRLKPADNRRELAIRRFESNTRRFIREIGAGACKNGEDE